ncbi:hypothetical protein M408DRAFT_333177 [Serendipita vermifera MAFF 305830]|uniref:Uncharacterized protein n=1 Tax=Serendipita vermifera MAFF 305830 TaxID=933852 RepID=A0A0C3AB80_SERVB|nr:hypothetical protein M408DRAFT_333177 [Serendipita vermifera MAFF 305830]
MHASSLALAGHSPPCTRLAPSSSMGHGNNQENALFPAVHNSSTSPEPTSPTHSSIYSLP